MRLFDTTISKKTILMLIINIGICLFLVRISNSSLYFITLKDEIEAGYKQYEVFQRVDNEKKLKEIYEIGNKLAKVSRERRGIDYVFSLIKEDNAFSGFAGFIYIGEEIYDLTSTEDELAFIMAHEMAHSDNRDTADSIEQETAKRYKGEEEDKISISEEMLSGYFFNRIQEYTADSQGVLYLYLAGFDPEAGIRVMNKLQKKYGLYPPGTEKVADHPSFTKRKRNLESFIKELKYVEKFYFRDGEKYLKEKNYDEAIKCFSGYLSYFYNNPEGYSERGYAYYLKAIGDFIQDEFMWDDGMDYLREGEKKETQKINFISLMEAKNDLEKAKSLNPDDATLYNYLGIVCFKLEEVKEAIECLKVSLKKEPKLCAAYSNLGVIYLKDDNLKEAEKYFVMCLSNCPDSLPATFNLAKLYKGGGEKEKAREYFEKYLQLDKNKKSHWRKIAKEQLEIEGGEIK